MREESRSTELGNRNLRNMSKADCKRERSRILGKTGDYMEGDTACDQPR